MSSSAGARRRNSFGVPTGWLRRINSPMVLSDHFAKPRSTSLPPPGKEHFVRDETLARVEAVLFSSREPVSARRLMKLALLPDVAEVHRQVDRLRHLLQEGRSPFQIEAIAGGYQMLTRPDLRPALERVCQIRHSTPVSGPMLETLAIVAYRQPICRADVEAIRGVQVGEILRHLLDEGLIRLVGKDESLGRPFLYGTTVKFLQAFGLRHLSELPMVESLARPTGKVATPIASSDDADVDEEPNESAGQ